MIEVDDEILDCPVRVLAERCNSDEYRAVQQRAARSVAVGNSRLALGLSGVAEFLLEQVDMAPLGHTFPLLNEYSTVMYWVIAFAIGTGLAIREHDDRTLAFLDGLPVSRSRVFFVKCAVMSGLVMIGPLIEVGRSATLHLLSRGSLDRELHGVLLAQGLAVQALLLINGLMLGAAFGRLRSLSWAAAGLVAAALVLLVQRVPRAALLNPLTLLDWEWTSAGIVVDGETMRTQSPAPRSRRSSRGMASSAPASAAAAEPERPDRRAAVVAATVAIARRRVRGGDAAAEQTVSATALGDASSYQFAPSPPRRR